MCVFRLTEVFVSLWRIAQQQSSDEDDEVTDEDEGWRKSGSTVVLFNQLVALELPDGVRVVLNLLEGVAVMHNEREFKALKYTAIFYNATFYTGTASRIMTRYNLRLMKKDIRARFQNQASCLHSLHFEA